MGVDIVCNGGDVLSEEWNCFEAPGRIPFKFRDLKVVKSILNLLHASEQVIILNPSECLHL
jgi:hypothetical protein